MELIHYSSQPIDKFDSCLCHVPRYKHKPSGMWVSVKGEYDWESWCVSEKFRVEALTYKHKVELSERSTILYLETKDEILEFSKEYGQSLESSYPFDNEDIQTIDWDYVKRSYQGIIIAPYQWECRFNEKCGWYYGWDCASGCIWDLDCIEQFTLIDSMPVTLPKESE